MKAFFWAIITSIIWGIVPVLEKLGLKKVHPLNALFFRCLGVFLGLLLLSVFFSFFKINPFKLISPFQIFLLIFAGVLASFIGQIFFYLALKDREVGKIVPIVGTYPLVSFILGLFFLKEKLDFFNFLGIIFIVLGIYLVRN